MSPLHVVANIAIIALLVVGIGSFRTPRGARRGNHAAALSLVAAIALVIAQRGVTEPWIVVLSASIGVLAGIAVAYRASMTAIPAVVAFQHGMGGAAAVLVSAIELTDATTALSTVAKLSGLIGLVLGAATFSASLLAAGKLANKLKQAPTVLPWHNLQIVVLLLIVVVVPLQQSLGAGPIAVVLAMAIGSTLFGWLFAMRIGGADMPVLISVLNATAGLAAAFCGIAIENQLLIVAGATVASSGSILTIMMCRAMNRDLKNIFFGRTATAATPPAAPVEPPRAAPAPAPAPETPRVSREDLLDQIVKLALNARKVIVVPGYGMALAHAQFEVVRLTKLLETIGKDVRFAVHPVAGRMPGHMNVLLAEADVDYDKLIEIEDANREFPDTDLVMVVGACDVVNPAALETQNTPLSGMPILQAHEARAIAVCNLDARPGYSGVDNPLYRSPRTMLVLGDAQQTVKDLHARLVAPTAVASA